MITLMNRKTKEVTLVLNLDFMDMDAWEELKHVIPPKHHDSEFIDGEWQRTQKTALESIRTTRNELLKQSDWTQMADQKESVKKVWSVYRQALKDFPEVCKPFNPVWPISPDNV